MLDDIKPLVEVGFAVHLLRKRSKAPIDSRWSTAPVNTFADLKDEYRKGMNLGVRLGKPSRVEGMYLHLIDLDIRDEDYTDQARETLEDLFPDVRIDRLPTVQSGSRGESRHFYFLSDRPFPSKKLTKSDETFIGDDGKKHRCWEIELFGTGKQAAIPPSIHPDTGKSYRWLVEPDLDLGIPAIDSDHIAELIEEREETEVNLDPLGVSIEDAEEALDRIQDWADDRDTWVRVGMALKHEFGPDGWELFDEWSRKGRGYDKRNNKAQWRSFKNSRDSLFTMRSIMSEAHSRARTEMILNEFAEADDEIDPDELKAAFDDLDEGEDDDRQADDSDETEVAKELGIPKNLLRIPGVLQDVVDYYNKSALVDQPQFAVQAALAFGSVILGRNWRTDYGKPNYASLFMINVGETGSGKESIKDAVEELLYEAKLDHLVGPRDYTSEGAVMSKLLEKPKHVAFVDELGKRLADDRKGAGGHKDGVYTAYLELFSKCHSVYQGTAYSTNNKSKEEVEAIQKRRIVRPALTLVGLTPPSVFYGAVSAADVSSGFLNRFLIVQSKSDPFQPQRIDIPQVKPKQRLIDWAKECAYAHGGEDEDEDDDLFMRIDPTIVVEPVVVRFSREATRLIEKIEEHRTRLRREYHEFGLSELFSRTREITQRVALIVAVSDGSDVIKAKHLQWAYDYVFYYQEQAAMEFRRNAGKSELQKIAENLVDLIKSKGAEGMTVREITRVRREYANLQDRDKAQVHSYMRDLFGVMQHKLSRNRGLREAFVYPKFLSNEKKKGRRD